MKQIYKLLSLIVFISLANALTSLAQPYTLWTMGNPADTVVQPIPATLVMGGASEDDRAMRRFLQYAKGGDVVVIRASGADGYNDYMYNQLGVSIHSVQTLLITTTTAANDSFVAQTVRNAEALWIAGGDQWNYISIWKNTALHNAINYLVNTRKAPIGGTSAGMAVMGEYYFSAQNGTVTSAEALTNPYDPKVTIGNSDYINNALMKDIITDSHFDDPDRRGRTTAFLARVQKDQNKSISAIACDEYTAVFIDTNLRATAYGGAPAYDDNAYFIRIDCEGNNLAETCLSGSPLHWKRDSQVIKVYKILADSSGTQYFDLRNFKTAVTSPLYTNIGGTWQDWWVDMGNFNSKPGMTLNCTPSLVASSARNTAQLVVSPNPANNHIQLQLSLPFSSVFTLSLLDAQGRKIHTFQENSYLTQGEHYLPFVLPNGLASGVYFIQLHQKEQIICTTRLTVQ